ncbi:phospholipase D-like domain-containing protein [Flavobacterium sp. LS1R10]|uniref:phospholipase D-like domain-containing protein n=1 Tax=Flavobacterium sp. LS1R10 TaxID=2497482 RepID=UPI000F821201|nr:phospholipase D-like domain-containing protein [Flavobacterium sp. LS1R10]RTY74158.1 hypothetical protein EKL96_08815 [Flavobacterium sp. LS1R10]
MNQEVFFTNIRNEIIKHLKECDSDLKIAVAWFTDKKIISEVNHLIEKGVDVSIIIYDDRVNQKDLFEQLYYNKAQIYLSKKLMHNKFCIIDNKTVLNGSYNWTLNANSNDENIQISYNNFSLANKFNDEFEKLASNCKSIDSHFEYSLSNLENIDYEFENYYSNWPKYKFPYFIDLINFKPSKENLFTNIKGYVYLLNNHEGEKNFLWYYFLLHTKYSINKILKIKQQKISLPIRFNYVHLNNVDKNNVAEFLNEKYVIEEHKNKNYNSGYDRYYIYSIDKAGQPTSEKYRYTNKLSSDLYLMKIQGNGWEPYFIDKNLKQTFTKYDINEIINNDVFIISHYQNSKFIRGLLNKNNEVVIATQFDNYYYKTNEDYIDFIEYPILEINTTNDYVRESTYIKYDRYSNTANVDLIVHRYSIANYSLIKKFKIDRTEKNENLNYFFLSDFDYKYKDFYQNIKSFKFDISKISLSSVNTSITVKEFNELKSNYSNITTINTLFNQYQRERVKLQLEKEAIAKKQKEGCYIATMVYKNYEHPDVLVLRRFRDQNLQLHFLGRIFISKYYKYSPKFVMYAENKKVLHFFSKTTIFIILKILKKNVV